MNKNYIIYCLWIEYIKVYNLCYFYVRYLFSPLCFSMMYMNYFLCFVGDICSPPPPPPFKLMMQISYKILRFYKVVGEVVY